MGRLGGGELLIILVIALLIFGPGKLAEMGKGLGQGLKNFKKGISQAEDPGDDEHPVTGPPAAPRDPAKALPPGPSVDVIATQAGDAASSDRAREPSTRS
jgi:sec-independent protein translocase protein TatA